MIKKRDGIMYIARQAVFDKELNVYGYELLFRNSNASPAFDGLSSVQATASVLGGLFEEGLEHIVGDKRALLNFDNDFIQYDAVELIDSNKLIIEVLEDVSVDEKLIKRLKLLKSKGYRIALDDFMNSYSNYPLTPLADIIKFDILATPLDSIVGDVKKALSQKKVLLAEKIENQSEFLRAKEMGFHLFQGYFFQKPQIVSHSSNHTTTKSQYGRLLMELRKEEASYQVLAEIIEKDVNLSYRLLRMISSRAGDSMIYSIERALILMGMKELERWIHILMLREISDTKPDELIRISLIRTKFAELIAVHCKFIKYKSQAALMGLFSTIDAMLNQNMKDALKGIALPAAITDALIDHTGQLFPIYQLMMSYEHGDWDTVERLSAELNIDGKVLYDDFKFAIHWSKEIMDIL